MEKQAITGIRWIPRGACQQFPAKANVDIEELREAREDMEASSSSRMDTTMDGDVDLKTGLEEFDLENYDNDEAPDNVQLFSIIDQDAPREKDPHIIGDPDSDSDSEDLNEIRPSDFVFMATSCDEDECNLELYVFDKDELGMYVHHDLMLGAYPLCIDWLNTLPGQDTGSFGVVGLFDHSIQIWDMNELESIEPAEVLGTSKTKRKKNSKNKSAKKQQGHAGPVLSLHSSPFNRSCLVSGSADETVKVWDVSERSCVHQYTHHENKVQCVRWHPKEQAVLLSAAFDGKIALLDVRQPNSAATTKLPAEAECGIWSQHNPYHCMVSCDNGTVTCYDVRKVVQGKNATDEEKVVWTLHAHSSACTTITDTLIPDCLITASLDASAKVWSTKDGGPRLVFSKDMQAGPLFVSDFNPEVGSLVCFGGKCPVMWDLTSESVLEGAFNIGDKAP